MSAPFTPEQEARLRQMMAEEVEIAVAAGCGDTPRLLRCLTFLRAELAVGTFGHLDRSSQLAAVAALAMDQANAEYGIDSRLLDRMRSL